MSNPGFVTNAVQVRLRWNDPVGAFMNVMHMVYTPAGPLNPNIADTIFNSLVANTFTTTWRGYLPATTSLTGVDVRDLRAANNPLIESTATAVVGTSVETALPPQSAMVVTLRTAFAGRAFRGRVYMGGLALNCSDANGRIAAAANTAAIGEVNAIASAMQAAGGAMGILQRWLPARPGHGGVTLPERQPAIVAVQGFATRDTIFDTQRRRSGAHIGSR